MFCIDSCPHTYIHLKQQFDEITHLSTAEWSLVPSLYSSLFIKEIVMKMVCDLLDWSHNPLTGYRPKFEILGFLFSVCFPCLQKKCKTPLGQRIYICLIHWYSVGIQYFWTNQYMKKMNILMNDVLLNLSSLFWQTCS